jgi:gamma-glutamylcysteine synthetase
MKLISDWTAEERQKLRDQVPKTGLRTPFRNGTVQDIAKEVVNLAKVSSVFRISSTQALPFPENESATFSTQACLF